MAVVALQAGNRACVGFGALVGGPLPIIDEAHCERLAGYAVSKRLREGQGGAAQLERLRHGRLIRRALHVRCVARLKCDPRLSEHLAIAFESSSAL
jgi:hypothetical protein